MPPTPDTVVKVGKCASTGEEISICYNTFGDPKNPCVLLVMGLGGAGPMWLNSFCEPIATAGYYVIRYDNRDVGLSTHLNNSPTPHIIRMALPSAISFGEKVPYTLEDMAADGMNLLTTLGIKEAHVVGCSMGGMIVQLMAINYPERVKSLNIIFSDVGSPDSIEPSIFTKMWFLDKPASSSLEDKLEYKYRLVSRLAGPHYPVPKEKHQEFTKGILERAPDDPMGMARQVAAIKRGKCRTEGLKKVKVPTLVIHGMCDQLIPYQNGVKIAKLIGHPAKLVLFPLMGHSLPEELIPNMVHEIIWNAQRSATSF